MILLISYDLLGHERPDAYKKVEQAILDHAGSGNYIKPLFSQFFVDTQNRANYWNTVMKDATDDNDCWLVTEVTSNRAGKYSSKAVDWLQSRQSS